jgi:predicted DNA-binding WGR domain protein
MHSGACRWDSSEPLMLRRVRPERNEQRFYALAVTADLFGNVVLMRHWGRIATAGKQREELHGDFASAVASLERLAKKKRRRGYVDYGTAAVTTPSSARPKVNAPPAFSRKCGAIRKTRCDANF